LIAGILSAWLFAGIFDSQPPANAQFGNGGSTSVAFKAGETKVIYVQSSDQSHQIHCDVRSANSAGGVSVNSIDEDITVNDWQAGLSVTVKQPGTYTIACIGTSRDTFGVGAPASVGRFSAPVGLAILTGALGLAGLITGIIGLTRSRG